MKCWLISLLLIFSAASLLSQTRVKRDSSYVAIRSFNNDELKDLKSKKEFQYNRPQPSASLWDRFWDWFWWKVHQLLSTRGGRRTFWSVLIIFGVAAIVFFILKLTGMDQGGLFGRNSKGHQQYTLSQNDIHNISFEEAIAKATSSGNYRLATRLLYLQALKKLSDNGYIRWQINKTNTDYLSEVTGRPFSNTFAKLTSNFEYTWYGEKQVSKELFLEISNQFEQFNSQV